MDSTVSKTQIPERELTYRTLLGDAFISSSIVPILLYGSYLCSLFLSEPLPAFRGLALVFGVHVAVSMAEAGVAWCMLRYPQRVDGRQRVLFVVLTSLVLASPLSFPIFIPGEFFRGITLYLIVTLFISHVPVLFVERLRWREKKEEKRPLSPAPSAASTSLAPGGISHVVLRVASFGRLRIKRLPECAAAALLPWVGVAYLVMVGGSAALSLNQFSSYLLTCSGCILAGWVILSLMLTAVVWGMQKNHAAGILIPLFLIAVAVGMDFFFGKAFVVLGLLMLVSSGILAVSMQRMLSPQPGRKPFSELTCALLSVLPLISCGIPGWLISLPSMLWLTVMCLLACGVVVVVLHVAGSSLLRNVGNAAWWRRVLFVPLVCLLLAFPVALSMCPDCYAPLAFAPALAPLAILYLLLRELNENA